MACSPGIAGVNVALLARVLDHAAALLRARLPAAVQALFDAADDTLFELAEHTFDGRRQQQYFDGLRECRRRRGQVEQEFVRLCLLPLLQRTADGAAHAAPQPVPVPQRPKLSL